MAEYRPSSPPPPAPAPISDSSRCRIVMSTRPKWIFSRPLRRLRKSRIVRNHPMRNSSPEIDFFIDHESEIMPPSIRITWRDLEPSAALGARIRELAQRLALHNAEIIHCHVIIALPHKHSHQGRVYEVRIEVTTPGTHLIAQHERPERHSQEDPYVAVRDAFQTMRRQLEDHQRKCRQDIEHPAPVAQVPRMLTEGPI
jgi:ribosome-associated translation inhibitor RaiA